ncbi:MAG: exodeoxyribonuclease VII large subunit, partial [Chloroflexi bacterium]|nr:exodeoxyribonuclease VII large subunit [Chloroflexota bacterium]
MAVHTVSEVVTYVRGVLDRDAFLADLYITGEISNLTRAPSGHCYFTIKDSESQLRCVMFRPAPGAEFLEQGVKVTAHGRISIYSVRGELQYVADLVQPEGVGELHMKFLQLKAKLEEEGLFDSSRKRPLPSYPKRIAVVTSRTGAVFHDIQTVLSRRYPLVELVLVHTLVQGDQAPGGIVSALKTVNQEPGIDVVVVARGGGSLEELWAFNDEAVARAIYASRVPVVSAVGHETDETIADYVADVRAPTPSAAAELVTPDRVELQRRILDLQAAARGSLAERLRR